MITPPITDEMQEVIMQSQPAYTQLAYGEKTSFDQIVLKMVVL